MKIRKIDRLKEVVEIENDSDKIVDISGWKLLDSEKFKHPKPKYRHVFVFPNGTLIKSGKVLKVHTFSGDDTNTDIYQNRKAPIWNNTNDVAILLDENENPASVFPQQPLRTISGYVYKAGTEKGIEGVKVVVNLSSNPNAPGVSATTEKTGYYRIENLAPAKYSVAASKDGYVTSDSEKVDVTKSDASQNFYLAPSSKEIKVSVERIEIIPDLPEWNKPYQVKVTFKNNSDDFYYLETVLKRKWLKDESYSEVPGTQQSIKKTYEKGSTWEISFTTPKDGWMDWDWYSKDSLGYAKEETISKKIQNQIWFKAIREEDEPASERIKEFEVIVKVSKDKREALEAHNLNIKMFWIHTAAVGALTIAAAAAAASIVGAWGAVAFAIAAALAAADAIMDQEDAKKQEKIMDDP